MHDDARHNRVSVPGIIAYLPQQLELFQLGLVSDLSLQKRTHDGARP